METLILDYPEIKFAKTVKTPPCQFTVEELKVEVAESLKDFENGNYVTIEKMRAKHPTRL